MNITEEIMRNRMLTDEEFKSLPVYPSSAPQMVPLFGRSQPLGYTVNGVYWVIVKVKGRFMRQKL
jgi:hypothetical protein